MKQIFYYLLIAAVWSGVAQTAEENGKMKMQQLNFMTGKWTGCGWMVHPDQIRSTFTQEEEIAFELNGRVMLLKGVGRDEEGTIRHNALAVISYDSSTDAYKMMSYLEDGRFTEATMELLGAGKVKWGFEVEGGTISYLIDIKDGKWKEDGSFSPKQSKESYPFIGFELTRQ